MRTDYPRARAAVGRNDVLIASVLFILVLAVYVRTAAPDLTWRNDGADGGDLATAAASLGIPHPTGYPTYMLLARGFFLLPLGTVAFRLNLLSAVCTAAAVAVLYGLIAVRQPEPWWGARFASAVAALTLAFAPEVWSQATITEVYALHLLFVVLVLASLQRWKLAPSDRAAWVAGAVLGLGLGNHVTLVLCVLPSLLYLGTAGTQTARFRWRGIAAWGLGIGVGLCVYLYLPLASWFGSNFHWGRIDSGSALLAHVGGDLYHGYLFSRPLAEFPARLAALGLIGVSSFQVWGIVLALLGLGVHWRAHRSDALALLVLAVACAVFALGYNTTDSLHYLSPALVVLSIWLGLGSERLLSELARRRSAYRAALPAALALGALTLAMALARFSTFDLSSDTTVERFALTTLDAVPAASVLISGTDRQTFGLWYYTEVRHMRPDVLVVDRDMLAWGSYQHFLQELRPELHLVPSASLSGFLAANSFAGPVYLLDGQDQLQFLSREATDASTR